MFGLWTSFDVGLMTSLELDKTVYKSTELKDSKKKKMIGLRVRGVRVCL